MKKKKTPYLFLLFPLFGILIFACSPRVNIGSLWQAEPLSVSATESWPAPTGTHKASKLDYVIANNGNNLYLTFKTSDQITRTKILRAGMVIEIETPENTKSPGVIKYPLPEERISVFADFSMPERTADRTRQDPREMFIRYMADQNEIDVRGFFNHPKGKVPLANEGGIHVNMDMDSQGAIIYHIIVPLNTIFAGPFSERMAQADNLLTVKINALEMPMRPMGGFGRPGMQGGGRTGPTNQGMQGGPPRTRPDGGGNMGADFERMGKTETVKINFRLNYR